jgi:hypothetical protein
MDVIIWLSSSHKVELKNHCKSLNNETVISSTELKKRCYISHPDIDKWIKQKGFDKYQKDSPTELLFSKKVKESGLVILVYPWDNMTERFNPFNVQSKM